MKVPNDTKVVLIGVLYRPNDKAWFVQDGRKPSVDAPYCKSKGYAIAEIDKILRDMEKA
jgi:hypothetical protein